MCEKSYSYIVIFSLLQVSVLYLVTFLEFQKTNTSKLTMNSKCVVYPSSHPSNPFCNIGGMPVTRPLVKISGNGIEYKGNGFMPLLLQKLYKRLLLWITYSSNRIHSKYLYLPKLTLEKEC